jgi:hypothetical protein
MYYLRSVYDYKFLHQYIYIYIYIYIYYVVIHRNTKENESYI